MKRIFDIAITHRPARVAVPAAAATVRMDLRSLSLALVPAAELPAEPSTAAARASVQARAPLSQFMEETDWHALAGKRVSCIRKGLMDDSVRFPLL
eukprot:8680507-Lingulodinium_polyedra.AAC.1